VARTAAAATRPTSRTSAGERAAAAATVAVAAALAAVLLAVGAWNALTGGSDLLNPDVEGSLFQLVSAVVTTAAAAAAVGHAAALRARRVRFAALGAGLAYVTVDDLLVIHERVSESFGEGVLGLPAHIAVRLWILLFAPLLLGILVLVAAEARRAGAPLGWVLAGGLAALLTAVLVEAVGGVTRDPGFLETVGGKPETGRYLLEEALELGGWTLVAGGLLGVLARESGALRR
jgi:hypothetical protein